MKIGIIGAGYIGGMLAKKLAEAGYTVEVSNSKDSKSLEPLVREIGPKAIAVNANEASKNDIVILALHWEKVAAVLKEYSTNLAGKILIDVTNPILEDGTYLDFEGTSASETIAKLIPGTSVVKAFNSLVGPWISGSPQIGNGKKVVFVSGDNGQDNLVVSEIIEKLGFFPLILGSLYVGGLVQQSGKPLAGVKLIRIPD
jgi:8-hydroxy-5-deazaflavin:NADPH oxidoreductase